MTDDYEAKKPKSVLFATVSSAGIGVLACVTSALAVDGIHASWRTRELNFPSLKRVCDFVTNSKGTELRASWIVLAVTAMAGGYGFAEAIKNNRQIQNRIAPNR